jgi:dynactin 1
MYLESDSDATNAYLFFQRIAFKADVINASVAQMNGLPESLNGTVTEGLVGTCDVRASFF